MKRILPALIWSVLIVVGAACSAPYYPVTGNGTPAAFGGTPAPTPLVAGGAELMAFLERLQATGARIELRGEPAPGIFTGTGHALRVNGSDVQVFEYPDAAALNTDTKGVAADGSQIGTAIIDWAGSPHLFKRGALLGVYVGMDPSVLYALTTAMSPQFAGAPTGPLPTPTRALASAASTPTVVAASTNVANCTDRAYWVSDVTVGDGTPIAAGQTFTKTWRLRNFGTCTWTTDYTLAFARGEQMGAPASLPLAAPVAPGKTVDLTVILTAPDSPGSYRSYWQVANAAGKNVPYGNGRQGTFWAEIVVRGQGTPQALPSATEAVTATVTTPTPAPTAGPEATATAMLPAGAERIDFPAAGTEVARSVTLAPTEPLRFVLRANAGQELVIRIDQAGTALSVTAPSGEARSPDSADSSGRWVYRLLEQGDYQVMLQGSGPNTITFEMR